MMTTHEIVAGVLAVYGLPQLAADLKLSATEADRIARADYTDAEAVKIRRRLLRVRRPPQRQAGE